MRWPPPLARVSEVPVPLHGRSPLGGHRATIAPLTLHAIDDGLSHAACGGPQRPASAPLGMLLRVAPSGSVAALARTIYTMKLAAMPAAPNKKFGNVT